MRSSCAGRQLLARHLHNRDRLPVVQISKPASADEHCLMGLPGPELIAAILAWLLFYNTFIHTPPKSFLTKRCGTFWEPNPHEDVKVHTWSL